MTLFLVIILILCIGVMIYLNLQVNDFEKKHQQFESEIRERFKDDPEMELASNFEMEEQEKEGN